MAVGRKAYWSAVGVLIGLLLAALLIATTSSLARVGGGRETFAAGSEDGASSPNREAAVRAMKDFLATKRKGESLGA